VRLLVLGGTVFLGRVVVETALAAGHEVTIFTRGRTSPELFPEAERLRGDREAGELSALERGEWDAVVDTSGYVPRVARRSAELLAGRVGWYVFVSSISVYRQGMPPGFDETWPVVELDDPSVEEVRGDTYGGLKVLCERAVEAAFPGRCTQVRAAVIVGPYDPTGRFTYWAHRLARGGEVLLPGPPSRPVQFVDVRDTAEWMLRAAETGTSGAFTVAHPPVAFGELVDAARPLAERPLEPVWADDGFLVEQGVRPWMELPLWIPRDSEAAHMVEADVARAAEAGLRFRPLEDSLRGALEQGELTPEAGLEPDRERRLLRLWHEQRSRPPAPRA
jgi:2'-hydroxyisoflavone reductase